MKVFLKYVLKSMTEKKGRFFLLILAISISTALLVTSTGIINIILDGLVKPQLEAMENKQINITSKDKESAFFSAEGLNTSGLDADSIIKEIYVEGMLADKVDTDEETMLSVTIRARDNWYINKDIIIQGSVDQLTGETCIISERVSENRNINIGDKIDVIIGGTTKSLKIVALSGNQEIFYNDGEDAFSIIMPYEYLSQDMNAEGKYNVIFADSSESTIQAGIDKFNNNNSDFTAVKLYDEDSVKSQLSSFTSILYVMLAVVVVMSGLIIYSSFKLIITERLSTIGTFLSQGATVGKVKSILTIESFTYGIFGAVLGNILGIITLFFINRKTSPLAEYGIYNGLEIEPYYLVCGLLFSIILSVLSAAVPIRKISRLEVKDIILNDVRISKAIGWKKFIIGTALIAISAAVYLAVKDYLNGYAALVLIASLTGVVLAYPKLIDLLTKPIYRMLKGRSKNVIFALNNLRTSKILLGNISLIIISLVSIISIMSLGSSLVNVVTDAYTLLRYDISVDNISTIRTESGNSTADYLIDELKKMGIDEKDINPVNSQYAELDNPKTDYKTSVILTGVDLDKYTAYNQYLHLDNPEYNDYIEELKNSDNGVIITTALNKMIHKEIGDEIEITCEAGTKTFKISGIIDGKLFNNGMFVLTTFPILDGQYGIKSANELTFVTAKNTDSVIHDLKPILRSMGASATTRDEMLGANVENNKIMVRTMSIFSYLAIVIASLGILNNVLISFLQRKGEFVILTSVGMENSGRRKILFFESVASVTWAMLITSVYSIFGLKLITIIVKSIGFDMEIPLDYGSLPVIYIVSLLIVLLSTVPVLFKSRKLSVIQEIG